MPRPAIAACFKLTISEWINRGVSRSATFLAGILRAPESPFGGDIRSHHE
jgi:hypothetical protein